VRERRKYNTRLETLLSSSVPACGYVCVCVCVPKLFSQENARDRISTIFCSPLFCFLYRICFGRPREQSRPSSGSQFSRSAHNAPSQRLHLLVSKSVIVIIQRVPSRCKADVFTEGRWESSAFHIVLFLLPEVGFIKAFNDTVRHSATGSSVKKKGRKVYREKITGIEYRKRFHRSVSKITQIS